MLLTQSSVSVHVRPGFGRLFASSAAGFLAAVFVVFGAFQQAAANENWMTDYRQAMAAAESSGRPVLALFTGSDWCPHCKTLEHNVFSSDVFRSWANSRVVLLMIDLPQNGISQAVRDERSQVCINYGVRTFPSVLLLGPDGKKLAAQTGYTGQSAEEWLARMQEHMPAAEAVAGGAGRDRTASAQVHESLDEAVEKARGAKRPILLVVARPGDNKAKSHSESLINDPEFGSFTRDHFVVAQVAPSAPSGSTTAQSLENLLGGVDLPPESVELIVTDDGQTPLFSQSGAQPPARIVNGLRRFLAARQASRFEAARR